MCITSDMYEGPFLFTQPNPPIAISTWNADADAVEPVFYMSFILQISLQNKGNRMSMCNTNSGSKKHNLKVKMTENTRMWIASWMPNMYPQRTWYYQGQETHHEMKISERDVTYIVLSLYLRIHR